MATLEDLEKTIDQAISDFDDIEKAIEEKGVEVPSGTDTSEYGNLIRGIAGGGGVVDQSYNPESINAQSGKAVAEAIAGLPIKYVESLDKSNYLNLFEMESGTYVLYGKYRPYPNATSILTFSKLQLVSISKGSLSTCVQVFYPPYNAIQYLNIWPDEESDTGYSYERKDAKLYYMEDTRNRVTVLDENATDEQYPTAKAVYDAIYGKAKTRRIVDIQLLASAWVGDASLYSQVVTVEGSTEYSQVDLTPTAQQLAIFRQKDICFVAENEDGVITVYVIGDKLENDYIIQATVTEVSV